MDTCTELAMEQAVDIMCCGGWVILQNTIDSLLNLGKASSGGLKLQKFSYTDELTSLEDCLVLMVYYGVAVWTILLPEEHKADAELLLHVGSKFFLVGTETTVLLQNGAQLLTSPVVGSRWSSEQAVVCFGQSVERREICDDSLFQG